VVDSVFAFKDERKRERERERGRSESDNAELSNCTLMVLNYLEQADQRKIGKKIVI